MPEDIVQISYEVFVKGLEQVTALKAQNAELQKQADGYQQKLKEGTAGQEKHTNALRAASKETRLLHKEIFALAIPLAAITFTLSAMAKGSESAGKALENLQAGVSRTGGAIANYLSIYYAFLGALTTGKVNPSQALDVAVRQVMFAQTDKTKIENLTLQAQTQQIKGDEITALMLKQEAERVALKVSTAGNDFKFFQQNTLLMAKQEQERNKLVMSIKVQDLQAQSTLAKLNGDDRLAIEKKYQAEIEKVSLSKDTVRTKHVIRDAELQKEAELRKFDLTKKIEDLNIEAETFRIMGDDRLALKKKQEAEMLSATNTGSAARIAVVKAEIEQKQKAERDAFELTKLGLKNQKQIYDDYIKNVVSGTQKTSSDVLFKFLQGEKQSWMDVLKSFQSMFNRAVSDAITESLFSSMTGKGGTGNIFSSLFGKKPTDSLEASIAGKESPVESNARLANSLSSQSLDNEKMMITLLHQIAECTCSAAKSTGGIMTATITPGKTSTLSKVGSIFGAISGIAGGLSSIASSSLGAGTSASQAALGVDLRTPENPDAFVLDKHSGGEIMKFPSGGEVPVMAQSGEFIVRKSAAQENKELLKSINAGATQSKSGQNIYFITANDAKSFSDMLSSPSAQAAMEMQITRAIMANGSLRKAIKNFGG
jgi:hypothetical protein